MNSLLEALPAIATIVGFLAGFAGLVWKKFVAMSRTITALQGAVDFYDACNRGVVLVITYPGCKARTPVPLLREMGWTMREYILRDGEGDFPDTEDFWADVVVADVVVFFGQPKEANDRMAAHRKFQDSLAGGAGVLAVVPDRSVFYDQGGWGDNFQSVTVPPTVATAVSTAVSRRRIIQRLQGVRPGKLAEARKALVGE